MWYYYGAKARLAPYYPYPQHDLIVEPFAGAAGYSVWHLAFGRAKEAILVDADPRVVAMWNRLLRMTPEQVLEIPVPVAEARSHDPLVLSMMQTNAWGSYGRSGSAVKVTPRMQRMFPSMLRRIARLLPHVKGRVTVIHGGYQDAPDVEATWFVDPPYQRTAAGRKHSGYLTSPDYTELAQWVRSRQGLVLACDQKGADWLPFRSLIETGDSQGVKRVESWWCNQPVGQPPIDNRLYPGVNLFSPTMKKEVLRV